MTISSSIRVKAEVGARARRISPKVGTPAAVPRRLPTGIPRGRARARLGAVASTLRSAHVFKDPALPLRIERVLVDWNVEDHAHEFQELVYVEKGRSEHEVALAAPRSRANRYELLPGDCFIIA